MKLIIDHHITLLDVPKELRDWLLTALTFRNPVFDEAIKYGRYVGNIPEFIYMAQTTPGGIIIPRGYLQVIEKGLIYKQVPLEIIDNRILLPPITVESKIKPFLYQKAAKRNLLKHPNGILLAPPGSGKTVMALYLFASLFQPMLWITHTNRLANQVMDRINMFLENIGKIGFIGGGEVELGDKITIALVQTLIRRREYLPELGRKFGLVIVDECLVAGTKILMLDGSVKNIEDIKDGDITPFGRVTNKFARKTDKTVILQGGFGILEGTPTHKLPYVPMENINIKTVTFGTMSNIKEGDLLLVDVQFTNDGIDINYNGRYYKCMPVLGKIVNNKPTTVYDFTTTEHLFIANGILSSNCHHTPSKTFTEVISNFSSYYLYGLTATPNRRDGLEDLMYASIGDITAHIPREVAGVNLVDKTVIKKVPLDYATYIGNNYSRAIQAITESEARTNRIIDDIIAEARKGNYCLVISVRKNYCEELYRKIKDKWPKTGLATGDYSKTYNEEQVLRLENDEITVLVTTFHLLGEGFDVPKLNRGFLVLPFKNKTFTEQALGRIQRKAEGKDEAILYDYVDENIGILRAQFWHRVEVYNKMGAMIEEA